MLVFSLIESEIGLVPENNLTGDIYLFFSSLSAYFVNKLELAYSFVSAFIVNNDEEIFYSFCLTG
jgi:hypothetical protein